MNPIEMLVAYIKAQDQGIVIDLENYADCGEANHHTCRHCPASNTCETLSDTSDPHYATGFENAFDYHIRPNLPKDIPAFKNQYPEYFI